MQNDRPIVFIFPIDLITNWKFSLFQGSAINYLARNHQDDKC